MTLRAAAQPGWGTRASANQPRCMPVLLDVRLYGIGQGAIEAAARVEIIERGRNHAAVRIIAVQHLVDPVELRGRHRGLFQPARARQQAGQIVPGIGSRRQPTRFVAVLSAIGQLEVAKGAVAEACHIVGNHRDRTQYHKIDRAAGGVGLTFGVLLGALEQFLGEIAQKEDRRGVLRDHHPCRQTEGGAEIGEIIAKLTANIAIGGLHVVGRWPSKQLQWFIRSKGHSKCKRDVERAIAGHNQQHVITTDGQNLEGMHVLVRHKMYTQRPENGITRGFT
ncbi:hypothetical protein HC891_06320 [Candidatus Gracilibacteria bacterium]|nr:hypothetical protein [Candidatus Gracilibacteria bacterium]